MAPLKFIVYAQLAVSNAASDCRDRDDCSRIAGIPPCNPVRMHHGKFACTVPCFQRTSCSLQWHFSSSVNAAGYSSGHVVRQPNRRSFRSCSPAAELADIRNFYPGIDRLGDPTDRLCGHLCGPGARLCGPGDPTGPERLNWRLLLFQTAGRKPVNIHQFFYSSKLVSYVLNPLRSFGNRCTNELMLRIADSERVFDTISCGQQRLGTRISRNILGRTLQIGSELGPRGFPHQRGLRFPLHCATQLHQEMSFA